MPATAMTALARIGRGGGAISHNMLRVFTVLHTAAEVLHRTRRHGFRDHMAVLTLRLTHYGSKGRGRH
jgi:hypothetical protein